MNLLGDVLLGMGEGHLLLGNRASVAQGSGGGWWQVGGQTRRSHGLVTRDTTKLSRDITPPKPRKVTNGDNIRPEIIVTNELARLLDPSVPRETQEPLQLAPDHLWEKPATPVITNELQESISRAEDEARRSQRDDEAERKRTETKARRDQRHQHQRQQRQVSRAHRLIDRERRAGERERRAEQAAEDETILALIMVALAT